MMMEQPQIYSPRSITWPLDMATAQAIVDTNGKTVCFVSRHVAEQLRPGQADHLMAIADTADQRPSVDESCWASVHYHHFIDGEYDEEQIRLFGADFSTMFAGYIGMGDIRAIQAQVHTLSSQADNIVVSCQAGRSRSAAVALWISTHYPFEMYQKAAEANQTVLALLEGDPELTAALAACRKTDPPESHRPRSLWHRFVHLLEQLIEPG